MIELPFSWSYIYLICELFSIYWAISSMKSLLTFTKSICVELTLTWTLIHIFLYWFYNWAIFIMTFELLTFKYILHHSSSHYRLISGYKVACSLNYNLNQILILLHISSYFNLTVIIWKFIEPSFLKLKFL